jgi:hypothetical protein
MRALVRLNRRQSCVVSACAALGAAGFGGAGAVFAAFFTGDFFALMV